MKDVSGVKAFVGCDAHGTHCNLKGYTPGGEVLLDVDVPTRQKHLRRATRGLPRPAWVLIEASTMAPFVRDSLEQVVDRVIVCETRENRWISRSEDKSDPADADRIARLLRLRELREVYVPKRDRQEMRELLLLYPKAVAETTRAKNRIKNEFRRQGIPVQGSRVYGRQEWLKKIVSPTLKFILQALYENLDGAQRSEDRVGTRLRSSIRSRREY